MKEINKTALLGPDSMWLKTTALQKAGVIKKKRCDCIEKDFLQMHATNYHSDINLPLRFLLMMFLSDALM